MHADVRNNAREAHDRDDSEAHDVLGGVAVREQVRAVDLGQVAHGVDEGKRDTPDLVGHGHEVDRGVGQGQGVGGPEAGGHDDEQGVPRGVSVDGADDDGADHGHGHPASQDQAAKMRVLVGEEAGDGGEDEGDTKDGDRHVLGVARGVAETLDESRVEVGQSRGANDGL